MGGNDVPILKHLSKIILFDFSNITLKPFNVYVLSNPLKKCHPSNSKILSPQVANSEDGGKVGRQSRCSLGTGAWTRGRRCGVEFSWIDFMRFFCSWSQDSSEASLGRAFWGMVVFVNTTLSSSSWWVNTSYWGIHVIIDSGICGRDLSKKKCMQWELNTLFCTCLISTWPRHPQLACCKVAL